MEPPDQLEKRIRFGCGFVFGALLAGLSSLVWLLVDAQHVLALSFSFGLACGLLAMRHGDRFWESASRWLGWCRGWW